MHEPNHQFKADQQSKQEFTKKHHHPHKTYKMFSKLIVAALASAGVASALPTAPGQAMNTTLETSNIKLNLIKIWKVFFKRPSNEAKS